MTSHTDILIAGGGFAGLSCAKRLAERGAQVTLLERKKVAGQGMHTTGIIVGECAEEFALPEHLTRKVTDVRLYAPNLKSIDLHAPDYFFLTTDTPALMRYLSDEAERAGAKLIYDTPYENGTFSGDKINVNNDAFSCKFLIGADGPRSRVADDFQLGQNTKFLLGAEAEFEGLNLGNEGAFHCFLDQNLARGYLGWAIPSVGVSQVGLAQRMPRKPDIDAFVANMKDVFDFTNAKIVARRGGLIPCGGLVQPFARENVILLGDSAGIVSPLTAGGIHTALHYGVVLADAIADYLHRGAEHPSLVMARCYPRFYIKQGMRMAFERLAPDWLLNLIITNPIFEYAASTVFFKKKSLK
ncbi:MAG: NAD(P)/FAD-dependent oxidoreductase [Alphaproteobacteria bacterium]|nr:NAD(P)/FAD-dependent oxidoreductase [Alphaproteobacteria bacterium]